VNACRPWRATRTLTVVFRSRLRPTITTASSSFTDNFLALYPWRGEAVATRAVEVAQTTAIPPEETFTATDDRYSASVRSRPLPPSNSGALDAPHQLVHCRVQRVRVGPWTGGRLRGLGLGQYEPMFRENEIDGEVLPDLTDDELSQFGVPFDHRKLPAQGDCQTQRAGETE
jgi:hypothetical protein